MALSASGAATIADLEAMPDDGKRYELIGGSIVMTPRPVPVHQIVMHRLHNQLEAVCPADHMVLAEVDYDLPNGDRVAPDLIVLPRSGIGPKRVSGPALLVVEILSPGSRRIDGVLKRTALAEAGVPAYWIIDPVRHHVLALRLVDGKYEVYADTDGPVTFDWPLSVSFSVAELARP